MCAGVRLPGIGTTCGCWWSSQASASWAGVMPSSCAIERSGAGCGLDRHRRIGKVGVVEVDAGGAELAQRLLGVPADQARVGVDGELAELEPDTEPVRGLAVGDPEAELRGDDDPVAHGREG